MFLLDTDVLSMLRRRERNPAVARWVAKRRTADLHLSVTSIGEIERGIAQQQRLNPAFADAADALAAWLDSLVVLYGERILPIGLRIAKRWGRLVDAVGHGNADLLIAATALERGLTIITRNVRHFEPTGASVLDPVTVGP